MASQDLMKLKTGKSFYIGLVDIETGEILETHPYKEAVECDFHTDFYFMNQDGDNLRFFWMNKRGNLEIGYINGEDKAAVTELIYSNFKKFTEQVVLKISIKGLLEHTREYIKGDITFHK